MKKMIVTLMVILSLLFSTVVSYGASDPNVVLVNPASNSTVYSNNLLISVKLTQPKTIKVKVFEEKQMVNGTLSAVNISALTSSNGTLSSSSFTSVAKMIPATFTSTTLSDTNRHH